ncbi:MAG: glycosyltransferase family A protein [bacterium]
MMAKPIVSVVMSTYNQAEYLEQALDSLQAQTIPRKDFEIIVVNDGSTDGTSEILRKRNGSIRLFEEDENRLGLPASCNLGLDVAGGRYFARVDSDDFVSPEWLERLIEPLETETGARYAYPDRYEMQGEERRYVPAQPGNMYSLEACGTLFRTENLRRVGGYGNFYWEEYDLYLRLGGLVPSIHVPEPLYVYRRHAASMTHKAEKRLEGWLQLCRQWGVDTLKSAGSRPDLDEAIQLMEGDETVQ